MTARALNCPHDRTRAIATRAGTLRECRTCGRILDPEPCGAMVDASARVPEPCALCIDHPGRHRAAR
jgi:hypothetical protein